MRPHPSVTLLLALAAACGDPIAPLPTEGLPRTLSYHSSSYGGSTIEVRVVGDTLVASSRPWDAAGPLRQTRRVAAAAEWQAFWRVVRAAGVRDWPLACRNRDIQDGGHFAFELAWADERRTGSYSNAYPTRRGGCSRDGGYTAEGSAFVDAVLALALPAADPAR